MEKRKEGKVGKLEIWGSKELRESMRRKRLEGEEGIKIRSVGRRERMGEGDERSKRDKGERSKRDRKGGRSGREGRMREGGGATGVRERERKLPVPHAAPFPVCYEWWPL